MSNYPKPVTDETVRLRGNKASLSSQEVRDQRREEGSLQRSALVLESILSRLQATARVPPRFLEIITQIGFHGVPKA